ncbi:MAG: hypothetical protein A2V67_04655 [Deltaproteobacteria bacterium RBG_13_61_14]|nr:MAG: hypothetical protein A2V67_04655 [Deltaproteobacteria bacterium RBG_13_61_14]
MRKVLLLSALVILSFSAGMASPDPACPVDPSTYPQIGQEEMAQLRWTLKLASQPLDDFSNLEGANQFGMQAYRYQIAFMTYALALEQYHKLPAFRELLQPAVDRLIQKIIQRPVWEFWAEVSRGVPTLEPKGNRPYPEVHDPVGDINIMYSGHLGHMIGLYEMLFRDFHWDQPGSIVFAWSEDETYVYDNPKLQQAMWKQMDENPWHSIACEPNAVFPECNQHPVLSFILYDWTHGTHLADVRQKFFDFFLERKLIDPNTHVTAGYYLIKQDRVFTSQSPRSENVFDLLTVPAAAVGVLAKTSAWADGWTGAFMHAWQPEFIERHYPYQRENDLQEVDEEMARLKRDLGGRNIQYGYFAAYAQEVGDHETAKKLIAFADQKNKPQWREGMLYYPWDKSAASSHLTGHLLFLARANVKDGLLKLHQQPWPESHFQEPFIEKVDYPKMLVTRAIYDREKKALIVSTRTGPGSQGQASFQVRNLSPNQTYTLWLDGKLVKQFQGQDPLVVEIPLDGSYDLVIAGL